MKLPQLYGEWRVMAGLVLLLLGTGNWLVGLSGVRQYRRMVLAKSSPSTELYRNFDELDAHSGAAVLAPLTQEQRTAAYAAAQMDFYHAVYLIGCLLFGVGLMMTLMAFIRAIRRDAGAGPIVTHPSELPNGPAFGVVDPSQDQPLPAGHRPAS